MVYVLILISFFACYGSEHHNHISRPHDRQVIVIQDDDALITEQEPSVEQQLERKNTHFKLALGGNILSVGAALLLGVWHFMSCGQGK